VATGAENGSLGQQRIGDLVNPLEFDVLARATALVCQQRQKSIAMGTGHVVG
jgi:riboflavin synthase alpha subunit